MIPMRFLPKLLQAILLPETMPISGYKTFTRKTRVFWS